MVADTDRASPLPSGTSPRQPSIPARLNARALLVAFGVLAAAILAASWLATAELGTAERDAASRQLTTVINLRMEQLTDWRANRVGDGTAIHGDAVLAEWIVELFGGIASDERIATLSARIDAIRRSYGYHTVTVYDRSGREWLRSRHDERQDPAPARDEALVHIALATGRIATSDLFVVESAAGAAPGMHLHTAVPLLRRRDGEPVGAILLGYDATRPLASFLEPVGTQGPPVELRLVPAKAGGTPVIAAGRQQGTLALVGGADPAHAYAEIRPGTGAARATRDEAGREALAAGLAIADSTWVLVARVEADLIQRQIASQRNRILALAGGGGLLVAIVLVALRREQQLNMARAQLAAQASLEESEARFHVFMDNSPVIAFLKDARGRLLYTNAAFRRTFGFGETGWIGKTTEELWPTETASLLMKNDRSVLETGTPGLFEQEYPGKDGSSVWLISKFCFRDAEGQLYLGGTAVDITVRRRQEEALYRQARALAASSRCGDVIARDLPEEQLLDEVCRAIVEQTGYRLVWIGYAADAVAGVRPVALAGPDAGLAADGDVFLDGEGLGGSALAAALSAGRPAVVRDLHADPVLRPGAAGALASCIGLPLQAGDRIVGALCIYAGQSDAFAPEEAALLGELGAKVGLGIARGRERAERRRVEAALVESEKRYRHLFTHAKAVELLIDPTDGRIVDANAAAAEFYGWPVETLRTMRISDINTLTPEQITVEMAAAKAEARSHFNFRHRLASGEVRDVEVHSGPIAEGERNLLYSIIHDVTDRRRAEAELRKLSRAIEQSTSAVIITSADGLIEYVNPAFERMLGYTQAEVAGKVPSFLQSPGFTPAAYRQHVDAVHQGGEWRGELLQRTKDGRDVWVAAAISPVRDADNTITHFIALEEDVTRRKETERALSETTAALERSNHELERLAMQDPLTCVSNRRHFTAVAERDIALARRHGRPLSVLMVDIDHFKAVNDTEGHAIGDEVLRTLAEVFQSVLRTTDHLGRFGGEEFVVLLPDTALEGGAASAERLRAAVAATTLTGRNGQPFTCTVSVGVAEWCPEDASVEDALKRADTALYEAKSAGRNAVRCAPALAAAES